MAVLCVNIDHVATLRQARRGVEPDPVPAAADALAGGADSITLHLREDRRHVQDEDLRRIQGELGVKVNLEMAPTEPMVDVAIESMPGMVMLVPEGRQEITTEGGLDVDGLRDDLSPILARLASAGLRTSAFIDAEPNQVRAASELGFDVCEVHTGPWAHAVQEEGLQGPAAARQLQLVAEAGRQIRQLGMQFNAGHALNYENVGPIAALDELSELHIGHSIVSRSVFVGFRTAVETMVGLIHDARGA